MDEIDIYAKKIWDYMLIHQELKQADAIFALGSNDTRVAERAADLYLKGYGKYIICAGGFGKATHFDKPEAEVFADVIIEKGVPREKIIIENQSTNTGENILFVKKLLEEKSLHVHSVIFVQKPYMERRTYATARKQWSEVEIMITSPGISYEKYWNEKPLEFKNKFIDVMVGDLERIQEYPKLGFQIEQEIPEDVWHAWEELVKLGFTKYKLK